MADTLGGISKRFAQQILDIGNDGLAPADAEQVRRLLLDMLGVIALGGTLPWTKAMVDWARPFEGTGKAPLVGAGIQVAPSIAALVNGTAAHGYELDDTHDASASHPGAVVIPAALAVAAELDSPYEEILAAIAAGYEAVARIGMAAGAKEVLHSGFHATALYGGFGSAAAAARLYGLDASGLVRAWGHVLSLAGGSMQFSDEPGETAVKRVHAGYAAQRGVLAAELSAKMIGAPTQPLEGKYGILALFSEKPDLGVLNVPALAPLQIHSVSVKPYSCCRLFHSLIDGLREVTDDFSLPTKDIAHIDVRGPEVIFDQHMLRRPESPMAAQYSMPFVVGATLAYGPYAYGSYREDRLEDPMILELIDKVEGRMDPDLDANFPKHFGTSVEITSVDGRKRTAKVMDSRGTPKNPLSTDELQEKSARLMAGITTQVELDLARDLLWKAPSGLEVARLFGNTSR